MGESTPLANDAIRGNCSFSRMKSLAERQKISMRDAGLQVGVDSPVHFGFDDFVTTVFTEVLSREAEKKAKFAQLRGHPSIASGTGTPRPALRVSLSCPYLQQALGVVSAAIVWT